MDEVELQHWMNVAACRTVVVASQALHRYLDAATERIAPAQTSLQVCRPSLATSLTDRTWRGRPCSVMGGKLKHAFPRNRNTMHWGQLRTERGVLPPNHPDRISSRMERAMESVEAGRLDDAAAMLSAVMEDEERWLYEVGCSRTRDGTAAACN
jgi:hypothetical protein